MSTTGLKFSRGILRITKVSALGGLTRMNQRCRLNTAPIPTERSELKNHTPTHPGTDCTGNHHTTKPRTEK